MEEWENVGLKSGAVGEQACTSTGVLPRRRRGRWLPGLGSAAALLVELGPAAPLLLGVVVGGAHQVTSVAPLQGLEVHPLFCGLGTVPSLGV